MVAGEIFKQKNYINKIKEVLNKFFSFPLEVPFTYGVEGYNNEKMLKALSKIDEEFRFRTSLEYFKINGRLRGKKMDRKENLRSNI